MVNHPATLARCKPPAKPWRFSLSTAAVGAVLVWAALASPPAFALDGCLVLLCLAAPSWSAIPTCVPPIRQLFHDLALGRAFPVCATSGAGNTAGNAWASAPDNCPPQYTQLVNYGDNPVYVCQYTGAVSVDINGALWTRTWWSMGGTSVTEYTDAAKAQLGQWNPQFDDDYAAWLAAQPAPGPDQP
jgi:hypothetical protein